MILLLYITEVYSQLHTFTFNHTTHDFSLALLLRIAFCRVNDICQACRIFHIMFWMGGALPQYWGPWYSVVRISMTYEVGRKYS